VGPCHHGIARPVVATGGDCLQIQARATPSLCTKILCMQRLTAVITCVHVSGGIFKTIILLFQQIALITDAI
jgi:hypothetical protein